MGPFSATSRHLKPSSILNSGLSVQEPLQMEAGELVPQSRPTSAAKDRQRTRVARLQLGKSLQ